MHKPPFLDTIRPGTDVPFDRERHEGEIYARSARVQLSLISFMKLATWLAVVDGILTASLNVASLITRGHEADFGLVVTFFLSLPVGAIKILVAALLIFPVYYWITEKRHGQVMRGKLSLIIPVDASTLRGSTGDTLATRQVPREGRVYAQVARIQPSFLSFIEYAAWVAVGVGMLRASFTTVWLIAQKVDKEVFEYSVGFVSHFFHGLLEVLISALLVFPIYRWTCEKRRGQLMRGKFSVAVTVDGSAHKSGSAHDFF